MWTLRPCSSAWSVSTDAAIPRRQHRPSWRRYILSAEYFDLERHLCAAMPCCCYLQCWTANAANMAADSKGAPLPMLRTLRKQGHKSRARGLQTAFGASTTT